jgi:Rha family phage regulatory protein
MSHEITATTQTKRKPPHMDGALVRLHMGTPATDSLVIADEFKRRHDNVLQSLDGLIADGTIGRLEFKESSYLNAQNKAQRKIELTERGALVAMPFIGGRNSRIGQVRLVNAFLALRDKMAENMGDWPELRKKVSVGYQMMCSTLQEVRADQDKTTCPHHYINEAKLINWVLFGRFEGAKRDNMAQTELALLDRIEAQNAIWIARGRTYDERKAALPVYLLSLRTKRLRGA